MKDSDRNLILESLITREKIFSDLHAELKKSFSSPNTLRLHLRELREDALIDKKIVKKLKGRDDAVYFLTKKGIKMYDKWKGSKSIEEMFGKKMK
jgi:DNA-binding HxlR family transcriptional regulator